MKKYFWRCLDLLAKAYKLNICYVNTVKAILCLGYCLKSMCR